MLPAYVVLNVNIRDPQKYTEYRRLLAPVLSKYGASFLVRGGDFETLEGKVQFELMIILRFENWDQARSWYYSREYAAIKPARLTASRGNIYILEGRLDGDDLGERPGVFLSTAKIHDPEKMAAYRAEAIPMVARYGGKILASEGRMERLEGDPPAEHNVLIAFENVEAARQWHGSEEYQAILQLRGQAAKGIAILAEGL